MSNLDPPITNSVREWLAYADDDLRVARHTLSMEPNCPFRLVAYFAQQSAEKYLKAYLVSKKVEFPYTHDIGSLLDICAGFTDWKESLAEAEDLSAYSSSTRYPFIDRQVVKEEALHAIELAESVGRAVREALKREGIITPNASQEPPKDGQQ
jgi:HEPN domain-containing protein